MARNVVIRTRATLAINALGATQLNEVFSPVASTNFVKGIARDGTIESQQRADKFARSPSSARLESGTIPQQETGTPYTGNITPHDPDLDELTIYLKGLEGNSYSGDPATETAAFVRIFAAGVFQYDVWVPDPDLTELSAFINDGYDTLTTFKSWFPETGQDAKFGCNITQVAEAYNLSTAGTTDDVVNRILAHVT